MAITITNTGADTFISDGSQVPNFNKNFIAGLSKATAISNPLTGGLDSILVLDNTGRSIVMAYSDITDINGDTPAALGLTDATEVSTYLNNNFFSLAGGGGGSLPAGTADKNNLQWNNTLSAWVDNPKVKFGYQNSDLSGYITGSYGTFDYGDSGYAWRWKSYPNADGEPLDNHVIADDFMYTSGYNSRIRRNVELLNVPTPEVIGANFSVNIASKNEWLSETKDYNVSDTIVAAPGLTARNTITPTTITNIVGEGLTTIINTVAQTKDYVQTSIGGYSFQHTIGFDGANVVWRVEGVDGVNTFNALITGQEVMLQILNGSGGMSCTADSASLVPTNAGGLYLGLSTITGSGSHSLAYGSYIYIQGVFSDPNAVMSPNATNASMLIATGSGIGIDPGTTFQPYNSVALGGMLQEIKISNTAYMSAIASRSVVTDAGGSGYTLDVDNDPINLIVMDVTALADSFFIPAASDKFLDLEIIVKKIGSNNLTIDDGGNGTVEQVGGGWGNTYVIGGANSAVTIKCILLGVNYYWIVY